MNTIRTLCERCIVLDHGMIVFDGNVEEAIALYLGSGLEEKKVYDLAPERDASASTENIVMNSINNQHLLYQYYYLNNEIIKKET